jgi:hypothetical protein
MSAAVHGAIRLQDGFRSVCERGPIHDDGTRHIVVKVLGSAEEPAAVKAGELAQGEAVTVDADEILRTGRAQGGRRQVWATTDRVAL